MFPDNLAALSAARELGLAGVPVTVIGATAGPAARSRFVTFVRAPDLYRNAAGWAEFVAARAAVASSRPVLFPTEDAGLLASERFFELLSPVLDFPHAAPGVIPKILDKRSLYRAARRIGIATPEFVEVTSAEQLARLDGVPPDWIVKPPCRYWMSDDGTIRTFLSLTGGSKAFASHPRRSAERILSAGFPALAQERIPGPFEELVSVGLCLAPNGEIVHAFTARKHCEYPEPFGDGLVVEAVPDPGIADQAVALLRALGYWGLCDIEFKRDPRDGRFKLLDANPRVWLWQGLGAACGAPLAGSAYWQACGRPASGPTPPNGADHPTWVSPRGSLAFLLTSYRPQRHGWTLPMRLTAGALHTILRELKTFHDPLYLRPSGWLALISQVRGRLRARNAGGIAEES